MKLSAEQIARFERDGYLFFPSLFSPAEIKGLTDEVPALYAQRRPENVREKTGDVVRTNFAAHLYSYPFAKLARHPRMVEPIKQVFDEDVYMHQFKINGKAAFDGDVWQWHQDYELSALDHQSRHDRQAGRARRDRRAERPAGLDDPVPRLPGARLDLEPLAVEPRERLFVAVRRIEPYPPLQAPGLHRAPGLLADPVPAGRLPARALRRAASLEGRHAAAGAEGRSEGSLKRGQSNFHETNRSRSRYGKIALTPL